MNPVLVFVFVALVAGCECGRWSPSSTGVPERSATPSPSSEAPQPNSETPAQVLRSVARVSSIRERSPEERAAAVARRRAHARALRAARRAASASRHEDALAAFDEALAALPNPRTRCEAGYVAFRAGRHEPARALVEDALRELLPMHDAAQPEALRTPLAMCLYNAGLVRSALGDLEGARAALTRSLALRPHATVERALGALPPSATPPSADGIERLDATAIDAMARAAHRPFLGTLRERACDTLSELPGVSTRGALHAMVIEPCGLDSGGELWVAHDARVDVVRLYDVVSPDAEIGLSVSGAARAEWVDVIPGGRLEVVVGVESVDETHVPTADGEDSAWSRELSTVVCAVEVEGLRCASWQTDVERRSSISVVDEGEEVAGESRAERHAGAYVVGADGTVTVGVPLCGAARGRVDDEDEFERQLDEATAPCDAANGGSLPPGRYALRDLLADPRVCTVGCGAEGTAASARGTPASACSRMPDVLPWPAGTNGVSGFFGREWVLGDWCASGESCEPRVYARGGSVWLAVPYEIVLDANDGDAVEGWVALCELREPLGPEAIERHALEVQTVEQVERGGRAPLFALRVRELQDEERLLAEAVIENTVLVVIDPDRDFVERWLERHELSAPFCWRGDCRTPHENRLAAALDALAEEASGDLHDGFDTEGTGGYGYDAEREIQVSVDETVRSLVVRLGRWSTRRSEEIGGEEWESDELDLSPLGALASPESASRTYR
jgi:hypothetical protein